MNIDKNKKFLIKGFTLVELVISIGIFAFMTAMLLAKYGTFNQGLILTNLAYEVALTIRTAQSYGLNVKSSPVTGGLNYSNDFLDGYGVYFDTTDPSHFIFFSDTDSDTSYQASDVKISSYTIKRNLRISNIFVCSDLSSCGSPTSVNNASVIFLRPNPNAIITSRNGANINKYQYIKIELSSSDGTKKYVEVRKTGQINITD